MKNCDIIIEIFFINLKELLSMRETSIITIGNVVQDTHGILDAGIVHLLTEYALATWHLMHIWHSNKHPNRWVVF